MFSLLPRDTIERLQNILSFVADAPAPFYREKYRRANFDVRSVRTIEDIGRIPLLSRSELIGCPLWDRAYLPQEEILLCGYTSGTTSSELFPVLRNYYLAEPPDIEAKKILLLGVQPWRVVGQAEWFRRKNIFVVCGDIHNLPVTAKLSSVAGIDSVYCTPTIAFLIVPYLRKVMGMSSIKTLVLSGESLSEIRMALLQKEFPAATIRTHYVFSEVGPLGFSCPQETGGTFFHEDKSFLYEIVDPDTDKLLPRGQEGELVVTTLEKVPTPLIRYRTGDIGILCPQVCTCSRKRPLFNIIGRDRYDTVKVGGLELKANAFEKGVTGVSALVRTEAFEVHIHEEAVDSSVKPVLVFKMPTTRPLAESEKENVKALVTQDTIIGQNLSIQKAEELGHLLPSRFEFIENQIQEPSHFKKRHILVRHM